jgi:pimeloyl-ACP methyl ester carboxylesterase
MAELMPNADLLLMPDTGHFAMFEQPEEFNTIVVDYLAG